MEEALREWECFDSSWYDVNESLVSVGDSWLVVVDMGRESADVYQFIPSSVRSKVRSEYIDNQHR